MTAVLTDTALTDTALTELTMAAGLTGFSHSERFVLVQVPEAPMLFRLRSVDEPDLEFVVVPPSTFFPDYAPVIDDASAERLGLTEAADALLLVILTIGDDMASTTANLLAPIVIHERTRTVLQVVLQESWPLRAPLRG